MAMWTKDSRSNPMTKEQFLDGIREMVQDMADPDGDWQQLTVEGEEISAGIRQFDPALATKFDAILVSLRDFGHHVAAKAEFLGSSTETSVGKKA
jgi:hypothetical protein